VGATPLLYLGGFKSKSKDNDAKSVRFVEGKTEAMYLRQGYPSVETLGGGSELPIA
jgi:hypothetical protein